VRIRGNFSYSHRFPSIKWNIKGWLQGMEQDPDLFLPFIANMAEKIDHRDLSPEDFNFIRKKFPEIFEILSKRFGKGANTVADLGDLGF
jgi:hypothetical protein